MVVLACLLAAACTSQQREQPAPTSRSAAVAGQRDYWPTAGWRTAPPAEAGMDPKVLAVLDTNVAYHPQLRSLLVVRHGYLVYERYWNGDAGSGQEAFSVTKSFTAALVGIALRDHHLKSLNQMVGELLAAHLPPTADPRLAKVTVQQLLTMTSGLAGDTSPGGDPDLTDRSEIPLDQANSRYLLHGGPLPSGVLADARHLPHGRSRAGDRHLTSTSAGTTSLDLVVVITSDADNGRDDALNLVGEAIIPAITD